ncbi:hypothetical protein [Cognatitamlana onchidii]|uniref:hypothetical protein n=1 Tax=Cognatitamlana onchidii TaxID=2562860 RepID=UPI0010A693FE|nr:hypothetical protein [Algibacter onchidii]
MIKKYDGKKYTLKEYLPVIFLFIFLIGFGIYTVVKKGEFEYVFLSTTFNESVVDIFEEKGNTYLLLTNKKNRYRIENSRNYDYKPAFLYDFIKENDRVIKNECSDTLYIERNSKKYHFLIGSALYNRKGKSKALIEKSLNEREIMNKRNDCN